MLKGHTLQKPKYFELFLDTENLRENLWNDSIFDLGHNSSKSNLI